MKKIFLGLSLFALTGIVFGQMYIYTPIGVGGGAGSVTKDNALFLNQMFVSAATGSDINGDGTVTAPYASIANAYNNHATNGQTVVALDGTFVDNVCQYKDGVAIYLQSGVIISNTASTATDFIQVVGVTNFNVKIGGSGSFYMSGYGALLMNACSNGTATISFDKYVVIGSGAGSVFRHVASAGISWVANIRLFITGNEMSGLLSGGALSTNVVLWAASNTTTNWYVNYDIKKSIIGYNIATGGDITDPWPYNSRVLEITCPQIYMKGGSLNANAYNSWTKTILNRVQLGVGYYPTTQTNFFMYHRNTEFTNYIPSGVATNSQFGSWITL
jgi:hypothetical protein